MNLATTPTLTRFRIQTSPPLEPIKAWHIISSESGLSCIGDLARDVALVLGIDSEVVLELDGFVLLATSPVGAVRDGDVITVKRKPQTDKRKAAYATSNNSQKRQKTESPAPVPGAVPTAAPVAQPRPATTSGVAIRRPSAKTTVPDPSSSSEATSSDSESDSSSDSSSDDSDSSSESSSDSDSESDSESDSDHAPTPQPIFRQPRTTSLPPAAKTPTPLTAPRLTPTQPPVPPGQGKQSTKNRNARRRVMRKHQAAGTGLTPTPQPRDTPLSQSPPVLPSTTTLNKPPAAIAPAKNANKNKRKGFDKDMAEAVATRTVFGPDPPAKSKSQYTHYHVVPPSERTDLPSNVIVTSVDVEAMDGMDGVGEWFDGEVREDVAETKPDEPAKKVEEPPAENTSKIDWEVVDSDWEKRWDSFTVVGSEGWKTLKVGELLGWQALTIDPLTCTPGTKIHLARVTAPVDPSSKKVECFIIDRPGADGVAFGYGGAYEDEEMEDGSGGETGESRSVEVGELESWKVIG